MSVFEIVFFVFLFGAGAYIYWLIFASIAEEAGWPVVIVGIIVVLLLVAATKGNRITDEPIAEDRFGRPIY